MGSVPGCITEDWAEGFHLAIDVWRGLTAKTEEKVLTFDGRVLRGPIVVLLGGEERGELFQGGMAIPMERPLDFGKFSSTIKCVGLQQGFGKENTSPHPLGYFIVAGSAYQTPVLQAGLSFQPEVFDLGGCTGLRDLKPLMGLGALRTLNLYYCTGGE